MKGCIPAGLVAVVMFAMASAGARAVAGEAAFTATLKPNRAIFSGDATARGTAKFRLSGDGRTMHYQVDAFDVGVVSQIHIHLGAAAKTPEEVHYHLPPEEAGGEIVVFLLDYQPDRLVTEGTIAKGSFTAADLIGSIKNQPLKVLVDHMRRKWAYVNVHIVQELAGGRRFCCPTGVRGVLQPE